MGLFDFLKGPTPEAREAQLASQRRQSDILMNLRAGRVPTSTLERLHGAATGRVPWLATLTPSELRIARDHGLRPIATVSATCWLHYGYSWTHGHAEGWHSALERLTQEAKACGANAVLDVKMRTLALNVENSMDFTLVGTAVKVDGLPPATDPVIATVPALEFVRLLEADVVPTGLAVGAHYEWVRDWRGNANPNTWYNLEARALSDLWDDVRGRAHADLRRNAQHQGNGVLAHVNFSQMFEFERKDGEVEWKEYLARLITVATVVDTRRGTPFHHDVKIVVDMRDVRTPLTDTEEHHQSYATNDKDGAI